MAKILDRNPELYAKERDVFLRDLQHFHETKGTPFRRNPNINGHEIDLYLLYTLVTSQGGWIKVNAKNEWPDLYQLFNIPDECINAGVVLKQLYLRYLDRWEKVHFLGEDHDRGGDDDEETRHKRWSARALHSVPLNYNYQQHNVADATREYHNLSTDLYKTSDYDRLVLSLISPLPNEQDFAVNVCTLLSNDGKHTLKLDKYPRLVDHLVAHAGIFNHSSLRKLVTAYYTKIRQHPLHNFWKEVLDEEEFLDLSNEDNFLKTQTLEPNCSNSILSSSLIKSDVITVCDQQAASNCSNDNSENKTTCDNSSEVNLNCEIFNLGRTLGVQDYVGQRVLQIATIFRNLSFIEENVPILAQNETFVRFMLLCSSARWGHLHTLGLDMLGNIVGQYEIKDLYSHRLSQCLIRLISMGLQSEDRTYCIASLDALNKLSQTELNEEVLARSLEPYIYQRVCSFLTLHDVMLLVYTLECLYSLTSLGERPCNLIVNIHGVLDTLVSLVTVEGKSYGPKACIGMKLVETIPAGYTNTLSSTVQNSTVAVAATTTTSSSTTSTASSSSAGSTTVLPVVTSSITTPVKTVSSTTTPKSVQRVIVTPASPVTSNSTTTPTTMSAQQLVQQQHAHQQAIQENEQFALAWLRATYEPCQKNRIDHQEVYKHYINYCAKVGRRGVIAPLHFPRCVRSVFGGTVGPNPMKPSNVHELQYYEGIKVRAQPLVISVQSASNPTTLLSTSKGNVARRKIQNLVNTPVSTSSNISINLDSTESLPPSPASPILKAQLSAPSKPRETSVVVSPTSKADIKSQVMAHPHLSQALLGSSNSTTSAGLSKEPQTGQSNTSLIKSLLATKVNDCMPPISMKTSVDCQNVVQVAARQQQQKLLSQQTATNKQSKPSDGVAKTSRPNGVRQLFVDDVTDSSVSSTTIGSTFGAGKKEPPQPPPPPLAPLSTNQNRLTPRIDNEDSNSTGNNSLASSSGINIGVSSTEDNDNSLTSFEGLLNGVPNIDNQLLLNDDSNSKDSLKSIGTSVISKNKPLMLADLLEKKIDKDPPLLNGMLGKELRIGDRGLELVENHIERALNMEKTARKQGDTIDLNSIKQGVKRAASEDIDQEVDSKKVCVSNSINGSVDSPRPESVSSSSNCEEPTGTVSNAAAKLFADIAADILEDEEEEMLQAQQAAENTGVVQVIQNSAAQQVYVDQPQQVLVAAQPRQILVSPSLQTTNQVVLPTGTQLKAGQTVIVQNTSQQRTPVVLQQSNTGQFLLSQGLPGQVQLVASTTQPGQYVIQTGAAQNTYVVAQSQTAVVHGQPQTVLVAQTAQQQGTGTKTIIILQQPSSSAPTHHQKVMVTPQGQQVVVTQVQRPLLQTATTIGNVIQTTNSSLVRAPATTTVVTQTEKKQQPVEEVKPAPKPKIVRDINWPFICEWGECQNDTKFKSANQAYLHVCEVHCSESVDELTCQWDRCDNMKRKRFSMMTHIYDKHCNTEAMKQSQIKRKQQTQSGKSEPTPAAPVTPHPGYAPDAALHAIKRHALEFVNPKELQKTAKQGTVVVSTSVPRAGPSSTDQDDNEGPVTKSMRLTAALILRNLVIYSNNCKRYLRHYEPHLANVALSNVESSRTVAQILYDMNESVSNR